LRRRLPMAVDRVMALLLALMLGSAVAADQTEAPAPKADDVRQQMLEQMSPGGTEVEPTQRPADNPAPTANVDVDTKVLGVVPGRVQGTAPTGVGRPQSAARVHRDGEFIISRRGRIVAANGGAQSVFAFDADSEAAPETPMVLLPCQMLQDMEDLVAERDDQVVFIL